MPHLFPPKAQLKVGFYILIGDVSFHCTGKNKLLFVMLVITFICFMSVQADTASDLPLTHHPSSQSSRALWTTVTLTQPTAPNWRATSLLSRRAPNTARVLFILLQLDVWGDSLKRPGTKRRPRPFPRKFAEHLPSHLPLILHHPEHPFLRPALDTSGIVQHSATRAHTAHDNQIREHHRNSRYHY